MRRPAARMHPGPRASEQSDGRPASKRRPVATPPTVPGDGGRHFRILSPPARPLGYRRHPLLRYGDRGGTMNEIPIQHFPQRVENGDGTKCKKKKRRAHTNHMMRAHGVGGTACTGWGHSGREWRRRRERSKGNKMC
ncbi:hypothetical protein, unlikely [Trypanosoma brucei brucei TREU927]|uniref:Uncharacterized protein n=1 Tax=Trypanosoma brucei brucei (strain 927/4 GUTat10.1) TaxID=185431 RepID=Q38E14_TRYB2|nr:hypothetical protein, unlikely [Trypanosoma brucei brucei TREU927]EAN76956.1 hypothetical protein, unlikely [Trypanosoma brucei brucei TREU927]